MRDRAWALTELQKSILQRIAAGEVMLRDGLDGTYYWEADKLRCTASMKSLCKHGYITDRGARSLNWTAVMVLTSKAKAEIERVN